MRGERSVRVLTLLMLAGVAACDDDSTSLLGPLSDSERSVGLSLVASGFTSPVALVAVPDSSGRLFVVDQTGVIRILQSNGSLVTQPFLDISSRMVTLRSAFDERGLLGLAFHPDYATNGRFFVFYNAPPRSTAPAGYDNTVRVSEFRVTSNPNVADPSSERIFLEVDKPQFNNNGGTLVFGPNDGYLYISLGDGGGANDDEFGHVEDWYPVNAGGNGQDITQNLLGSILRINVNSGNPYSIPSDNPFVNGPGLDEIFAYGFRNPWKFSFDLGNGDAMLVGDVGQELWEEVSLVQRGGNYGWNVKEGTHCFNTDNNRVSRDSCPSVDTSTGIGLTDPVVEYAHVGNGGPGLAVIGGFVYRGTALEQLEGRYVFGDWSRTTTTGDGTLLVAAPRSTGLWPLQELIVTTNGNGRLNAYLLGFGQDSNGELYVLTSNNTGPTGSTGRVYRIVRSDD